MKYVVDNPDFKKSPYTGMTKKHWIDAAQTLMDGVFSNIKSFDSPMVFPRHEKEISYPQEGDLDWMKGAEMFEGVVRTFLVAAPLIKNKPDAEANGYNLRDYYANLILKSVDPQADNFCGSIEEMIETKGIIPFQNTCECAGLVIGLMYTKDLIWDKYTEEERDLIADYLSDFGHHKTNNHNWRLFNMLILTFLKINGYEIDEGVLKDHTTSAQDYYVGDGWYRDGQFFDYYSPMTFQVYGPIWNDWYGYEHEPELAALIEKRSNDLMDNYPNFFDEDAHMIMWGRSNIYRNAASSPLAANFLLENSTMDPGLARRILSGNLLQFITKEEFYKDGVPALGFYDVFPPLIQTYSCAASPFWFGKAFMCLYLEDDSPFWTEKETNGVWEDLEGVNTMTLDGPGISVSNFKETGATEMRTSKVFIEEGYASATEYSRLAFNSKFPWEDFDNEGPEAMQYSLRSSSRHWEADDKEENTGFSVPNLILYGGEEDGVLYRRIHFDFITRFQTSPSIDLADIPIDNGVIRVDKIRIPEKPYELKLGHYGLPNIDGVDIETRKLGDLESTIAKTKDLQVAMTPYLGWDKMATKQRKGKNAITEESTLIYAESKREKMYDYKDYILVTAMLHKTDNEEWTDDQLDPIASIDFEDPERIGNYGAITINLKNGQSFVVDFEGLEGKLVL